MPGDDSTIKGHEGSDKLRKPPGGWLLASVGLVPVPVLQPTVLGSSFPDAIPDTQEIPDMSRFLCPVIEKPTPHSALWERTASRSF